MLDQEYQQSKFYQFELLVIDDAHKLAAVDPVVQQLVKDDGNGCQAVTIKGKPWVSDSDIGSNMTFDTFDATVSKGNASMVYPILVREFITPDFGVNLEDSSDKSAGTPF